MKIRYIFYFSLILLLTDCLYADSCVIELLNGESISAVWYELDTENEIVKYRQSNSGPLKSISANNVIDIKVKTTIYTTEKPSVQVDADKTKKKRKKRKPVKRYKGSESKYSVWRNWKLVNQAAEGSPVHAAASSGSLEKVKSLIDSGVNVNLKTDFFQNTPLHIAVMGGHADVVNFLLFKGADINAVNSVPRGYVMIKGSPLHFAVATDRLDMIELLLNKGANLEVQDQYGETPLFKTKNPAVVKYLTEKGANINARNNKGQTVASQKAGYGNVDVEIISYFINKGLDINSRDNDGNDLFQCGVKSGYRSKMERIYRECNKPIPSIPFTKEEAFGVIMKGTLSGESKDKDNFSLLKRIFQENPNFVFAKTKYGQTPLHKAARSGRINMVKLILTYHPDINARDNEGNTPLTDSTDIEVIKVLVSHGADVNARNNKGNTALHEIADLLNGGYHKSSLDYLISVGADKNIKNNYGQRPYDIAKADGNLEYAENLR